MATEKKFIRLDDSILLEWVFSDDNFAQEDYSIINNLSSGTRSYVSSTGMNTLQRTLFPLDKTMRKYAAVDTARYNFLKVENYSGNLVEFDTFRLHMPTDYSFYNNQYTGLYARVYTYDYTNTKQVDICGYFYDDTNPDTKFDITFNQEFLFAGRSWGKYITVNIPSLNSVSKQRNTGTTPDFPLPDTINQNLCPGTGISTTSPIFVEFSFISTKTTVLGVTTFRLTSPVTNSLNMSPEYQDAGVTIQESTEWDYFEIFGTYDGSNEEFDDYVDSLVHMGRSISVDYIISQYEENILSSTYTFTKTDNFAQKIIHRPVIMSSNTTALLKVEMRINDNTDGSYVSRFASVGLTSNILKYGKKLMAINMANAYKPKIYNLKTTSGQHAGNLVSKLQDIKLTKVNYPIVTDRTKLLMSSTSSPSTDYKSFGLAELIINPFDNFVKLVFGEDPDNDGTVTPYDLSKLMENSSLFLVFRDDAGAVEKGIFQETDQNNYKNGVVVFKIEESDVPSIKSISQNNTDFHVVVRSNLSGTRTLLYSGKFVMFDKVKFVDTGSYYSAQNSNANANMDDFFDTVGQTTSSNSSGTTTGNGTSASNSNMNAFVLLNLDADSSVFETYLSRINANIYFKRAGGNDTCGSYVYMLLNISKAIGEDVKKQAGVKEVIFLPFDLGKNTTATAAANATDTAAAILAFNCDVADRTTNG